jgi:hypothetical protein
MGVAVLALVNAIAFSNVGIWRPGSMRTDHEC